MGFLPEIRFDFVGIVFLIFVTMVAVQLFYLFIFHLRLLIFKPKAYLEKWIPLTVIICARNEEDNLFHHLPKILEQDYPEFEVIVVNDQSLDDSKHILHAYRERYPFLKIIELERSKHRKFGKKVPLTIGIKGAKYEHLVMIDADCYPASNQWLKIIARNYVNEKAIVIGYGPYEREKGLLNKLIRFDSTSIAITYFSFANANRPYMAVGRNMSYTKTLFFEVDGFKSHYHIQSGDDDLFIQEAGTGKNVTIEMEPESYVYSIPKKTWKAWFKQKQRHYTTAPNYRLINKLFLGIFPLSMILMLLSFVILVINYEWWWFATAILVLRMGLYWLINGLLFKKFKSNDLIIFYPLYEIMHFFLMPFVYYSAEPTVQRKW